MATKALRLLIAATLVAMTATAQEPACDPASGLEPLLGEGRVLLLGEIHGTNEAPWFVGTVACHALARGLALTVALELPHDEESAVRDPAASIIDLPFWSRSYQDGRTSEAMLRLIERVREWRAEGGEVDLLLLDDPAALDRRDEVMAGRLLDAVAAAPGRFVVALTGNLHSRTAPGSGRMGERVASALGRDRVTALDMTHAGGTAWICEATAGCGPLRLGERPAAPAGEVTLFETRDERGYDGTYSVGTVSASPPAGGEG